MNNKEIKDFLKDNEENNYQLEISATLGAIVSTLIKNNLTTEKEFVKFKKHFLEKIKDKQIERMTDKEKQQLEEIKKIKDFFGGLI